MRGFLSCLAVCLAVPVAPAAAPDDKAQAAGCDCCKPKCTCKPPKTDKDCECYPCKCNADAGCCVPRVTVPKVPGVVKANSCDPFVVEIELPPDSVMGWAPGFAPEDAFVDEMKPLRADTARLIILPKKSGIFRVILWLKGETDYITLIIDATDIPKPKDPPSPEPKPPGSKVDPVAATGKLRFGSAGCTATVIGPRRPDGKWDVLTAAHCNGRVGSRGTFAMKDGKTLNVTVTAKNDTTDLCWMVTDDVGLDLPHALIAATNPVKGTAIWHQGYGVDRPGNRESGVVLGETSDGMLQMDLSVSSGDSGSGIFREDTGELIAVVCCTTGKGVRTVMYGGSATSARKLRPATTVPEAMPENGSSGVEVGEWRPRDIPLVVVG